MQTHHSSSAGVHQRQVVGRPRRPDHRHGRISRHRVLGVQEEEKLQLQLNSKCSKKKIVAASQTRLSQETGRKAGTLPLKVETRVHDNF